MICFIRSVGVATSLIRSLQKFYTIVTVVIIELLISNPSVVYPKIREDLKILLSNATHFFVRAVAVAELQNFTLFHYQ